MRPRGWWLRTVAVGALALTLTVGRVTPGPDAPGPTVPPQEQLAGSGGIGMRLACMGCIGAVVFLGWGSPALMIQAVIQNPALLDACTLACIQAVM